VNLSSDQTNLEKLLQGLDASFSVPVYQRSYSWKQEELEEVWEDILNAFRSNPDSSYFLGAIVLSTEDQKEEQYQIIDGQQRLATLSVLFATLAGIVHNRAQLPDIIEGFHLQEDAESKKKFDKAWNLSWTRLLHPSEPDHYFLRLNNQDNPVLRDRIFVGIRSEVPLPKKSELKSAKKEHRLLKAKKFFFGRLYEFLQAAADPAEELNQLAIFLIKHLALLKITVREDYDAYLLFESLNAKGLDLSTSDLLKNRLLLQCAKNDTQRNSVLSSWDSIEKKIRDSSTTDLVSYLHYYWSSFHSTKITKKQLYSEIKSYLKNKTPAQVVRFVDDLRSATEPYCKITKSDERWPQFEAGQRFNSEDP